MLISLRRFAFLFGILFVAACTSPRSPRVEEVPRSAMNGPLVEFLRVANLESMPCSGAASEEHHLGEAAIHGPFLFCHLQQEQPPGTVVWNAVLDIEGTVVRFYWVWLSESTTEEVVDSVRGIVFPKISDAVERHFGPPEKCGGWDRWHVAYLWQGETWWAQLIPYAELRPLSDGVYLAGGAELEAEVKVRPGARECSHPI
jgi:hypothetical protein